MSKSYSLWTVSVGWRMKSLLIVSSVCALLGPPRVEGSSGPAGGSSHKLEVRDAAQAARIVAQGGSLIADYGGYQLYRVPEGATGVAGENRDHYNLIRLNAVQLDTSTAGVQALRRTVGSFSGKRMHLVQFAGPVQPSWREELLKAGAQIVSYIPQNAYLVYGDAQAIGQIQSVAARAEYVQWDGAYLDDYRLHPEVRLVDSQGKRREFGAHDEFAIQLFMDVAENRTTLTLVDQLKRAPISFQGAFQHYRNLVVELAPADLPTLASRPDVKLAGLFAENFKRFEANASPELRAAAIRAR